MTQWVNSPACQTLAGTADFDPKDLLHNFFKKYIGIVAENGFHVDAWDSVFTYQKKNGDYDAYDIDEWGIDTSRTNLTALFANNIWLNANTPALGYILGPGFLATR